MPTARKARAVTSEASRRCRGRLRNRARALPATMPYFHKLAAWTTVALRPALIKRQEDGVEHDEHYEDGYGGGPGVGSRRSNRQSRRQQRSPLGGRFPSRTPRTLPVGSVMPMPVGNPARETAWPGYRYGHDTADALLRIRWWEWPE